MFGSLFLRGERFLISFEVFRIRSFFLSLDFVLDKERFLFFFSLRLVAGGVVCYSSSYMLGEKYFHRFIWTLVLFVLSIVILIFSANLFTVIVGWDGLGVTSFLLVIFFQNKNSANAGLLTIFTNRIGDVFIIVSMGLLLVVNSWRIRVFAKSGAVVTPSSLAVMFVIAAFTKRAQIPFSRWLPAAMAAPTPVSSLVHSSTLVTAGVYLVFRFKDVLLSSSRLVPILLLGGGRATIVIAGGAGLYEDDLKKLVALSTLRQLGVMVACLGLGAPSLAFFHLLSHAYFKALLFIVTGRVIHSVGGYQDLRLTRLPYRVSVKRSSLLLFRNMSLIGFPFLRGFYSKDLILELVISRRLGIALGVLFLLGTSLTVLYSFRFILFSGRGGILRAPLAQHLDSDWLMYRGYDFLFVLALVGGSLLNYSYLRFSPALILSVELKNLILPLILARGGCCLLNLVFFPVSLKLALSSLLGLRFLSKSLFKARLFWRISANEKLVEKLVFKTSLFSSLFKSFFSLDGLSVRSFLLFSFVCSIMGAVLILC